MEKIVCFIIISAAVAILSSFLPWVNLMLEFGFRYSWNGLRGDGWFVIIFAVVAIVLACLNDVKILHYQKGFANWCYRIWGSLNCCNID